MSKQKKAAVPATKPTTRKTRAPKAQKPAPEQVEQPTPQPVEQPVAAAQPLKRGTEEWATAEAKKLLGPHALAWCVTKDKNGVDLRSARYRIGVPAANFSEEWLTKWKVRETPEGGTESIIWGIGSNFTGALTSARGCRGRYPVPPTSTDGLPMWEPAAQEVAA
jgi:hypothetical protein